MKLIIKIMMFGVLLIGLVGCGNKVTEIADRLDLILNDGADQMEDDLVKFRHDPAGAEQRWVEYKDVMAELIIETWDKEDIKILLEMPLEMAAEELFLPLSGIFEIVGEEDLLLEKLPLNSAYIKPVFDNGIEDDYGNIKESLKEEFVLSITDYINDRYSSLSNKKKEAGVVLFWNELENRSVEEIIKAENEIVYTNSGKDKTVGDMFDSIREYDWALDYTFHEILQHFLYKGWDVGEDAVKRSLDGNLSEDDKKVISKKECLNNLRKIEMEILILAMEEGLDDGTVVTFNQIDKVKSLKCPEGGEYKLNPVGISPECSVHGSLRQDGNTKLSGDAGLHNVGVKSPFSSPDIRMNILAASMKSVVGNPDNESLRSEAEDGFVYLFAVMDVTNIRNTTVGMDLIPTFTLHGPDGFLCKSDASLARLLAANAKSGKVKTSCARLNPDETVRLAWVFNVSKKRLDERGEEWYLKIASLEYDYAKMPLR